MRGQGRPIVGHPRIRELPKNRDDPDPEGTKKPKDAIKIKQLHSAQSDHLPSVPKSQETLQGAAEHFFENHILHRYQLLLYKESSGRSFVFFSLGTFGLVQLISFFLSADLFWPHSASTLFFVISGGFWLSDVQVQHAMNIF